jgi:hypothetical protein
VCILDDPRAAIELPSLATDVEIREREPDPNLIYAALAALRASQSLERFYSSLIQDSKNRLHQIAGCVERVRKDLEEREKQYVSLINMIMKRFPRDKVLGMRDQNKHQHILELAETYVDDIRRRQSGTSEPGLRSQIIHDTYIYFSYIFHRALKFIKDGNIEPPRKSKNDYEDGRICLHLKLDTPYCLVTNDRGTRDALEETVSLLGRLSDPQFQTTLETCDAHHLNNLVGS